MKFVSIRELRSKSAQVWRELAEQKELVVTSNGKPIGILSATDEQHVEQALRELRRARAQRAVHTLQQSSTATGRDKLTPKQIETEIAAARAERRR